MASMDNTFAALLAAAPEHHEAETITATGVLARTGNANKFALVQADGYAITLDISAVKTYNVIGSSFGQQIVEVELDAKKIPPGTYVPRPADKETRGGNDYTTGNSQDHPGPVRF